MKAFILGTLLLCGYQSTFAADSKPYYYDASISPKGETRPMYSPDGKWLAFMSAITGNGDIYLLELKTGNINRLTYDEMLNAKQL